MDPVTLTDGVVLLSRPVADDVDALTETCQDPEIAAWTTVPSPYTRDHAVGFVTGMVEPGWAGGADLVWAVRVDGELAGMIGLHHVRHGSAEVGYWLAAGHRGRGVLGRALHLVLAWAFDDPEGPGLAVIEWRAIAGNWPSWRAVWRLGFRFDGVARLGVHRAEGLRDDWLGSLLRDEPRRPRVDWPGFEVVTPTPPDGPVRAVHRT